MQLKGNYTWIFLFPPDSSIAMDSEHPIMFLYEQLYLSENVALMVENVGRVIVTIPQMSGNMPLKRASSAV